MKSVDGRVLDALTAMAAIAALILAGRAFLVPPPPAPGTAGEDRVIDNWQEYTVGHRVGPAEALLTIVEFGDYECPACRTFQPILEEFLETYPHQVALIYRHFPLGQHRNAYGAARAAECAGAQGRFFEFHKLLYREDDWLGSAFRRFAEESGVSDMDAFERCISDDQPVPTIERDLSAAIELGAPGTPTILVNGVLLGRTPSLSDLEAMLPSTAGT